MRRIAHLAACAALSAVVLTGCGDDEPEPAETTDLSDATVTVHFHDSSVPPEYHRSWEVVLDAEQMTLLVDSYGDEIASQELAMPAQEWDAFVEGLPAALEDVGTDDAGEVCPGGTSIDLEVDGADDADRTVTAAPCGDDAEADALAERIEAVVQPFRDPLGLDDAIAT